MTADMAFECLLVSRNAEVVSLMNRTLGEFSISTNICLTPSKAFNLIAEGSTDLVVIDCEDDNASAELLHSIRNSGRWRKPTVVSISAMDHPMRGAHLALPKPVTPESAAKLLKVAYARMLQDHRRYARYALMISLVATAEDNRTVGMTITDIGSGGVGLSTKEELAIGDVLTFRVLLPSATRAIEIQSRVLWTREYGVAGCEFVCIPPVDLDILHDWLARKNPIKKPLIEL
jgi:hypothetical protein